LTKLITPGQDAGALANVLKNRDIGHFSVKILQNRPSHKVNEEIVKFFSTHERNDLLLLYISCHGIKDVDGQLYFATVNTRRKLLHATAVSSDFVNKEMFGSSSRKQILLLDCCYSGAFARGMRPRADNVINTKDYFEGGHGKVVITASDAMQYAFEEDRLSIEIGDRRSVFTRALIEGLETGQADLDKDGRVSDYELYNYIHNRVTDETPLQRPGRWGFDIQGEIIVAQNPKRVEPPVEPKKVEPIVEPKSVIPVEPKKVEPIVEPKSVIPVEPKKVEPIVEPKKEKIVPTKPRKRMPIILTAIIVSIIVVGVLIYYIEQPPPQPPQPPLPSESSNHLPVANNQSVTTSMNKPIDISLPASDKDNNDLTATVVKGPSHGTLSDINQNTGVVTYSPNADFSGTDSFQFIVNDGEADSNKNGIISIAIKQDKANNAPVANNQSVTTSMNKPIDISLPASDKDNNDLTAAIVDKPENGSLSSVNQNTGVVTYTPNPGFVGTDKFTFKVSDAKADSDNNGIISITVKS
jgi:hypothetical protein